jgi:AcrR family transcriptional regulator
VTGRREANKQRTRDQLEEAALRLFLERGYDRTSVTEVAAAAAVAERTFFRYFASKEGVVFCRVDDDLEDFSASMSDALRSSTPTWADLARGLEAFGHLYEPAREITRLRAQLVQQTPSLQAEGSRIRTTWRNHTALLLAVRYNRPIIDGDIQLLAGVTIAVLSAAVSEWVRTDPPLSDALAGAIRRVNALLRADS